MIATDIDAWHEGVALALKMLEVAEGQNEPMGMDPTYRTAAQRNVLMEYLSMANSTENPSVVEGFTATLSDYISSCQSGGVPDISALDEDASLAARQMVSAQMAAEKGP